MLRLLVGVALAQSPQTQNIATTPTATDAVGPSIPADDREAPATDGDDAASESPIPVPDTELFITKCSSCHSVGEGDRVGPDLKGVTKRRKPDWLKRMIKTPSRLLDTDPEVRALVAKYKNVRMPDLGLSDERVDGLVALLTYCSDNPCKLAAKLTPVTKATEEDAQHGRAIFLGTVALENRGPACVSCHTVDGVAAIVQGGTLSKKLTHVFARLGDAGLDAALRNPAFPLMNKVFTDHPIAAQEAFALRAFLYDANRGRLESEGIQPMSVPLAAALVALLILILLNAAWSRRLRGIRQPFVQRERQP